MAAPLPMRPSSFAAGLPLVGSDFGEHAVAVLADFGGVVLRELGDDAAAALDVALLGGLLEAETVVVAHLAQLVAEGRLGGLDLFRLDRAQVGGEELAAGGEGVAVAAARLQLVQLGREHGTDLRLVASGDEPLVGPAPLGEGVLDYPTYLKLLGALELDTPVIVPPQPSDAAYRTAQQFLAVAAARRVEGR